MSDVNCTLYVGIDVSKGSNQVFGMDFDQKKLLSFNSPNNNDGASIIEEKIVNCLTKNSLNEVVIILESTGIYSYHISVFLSASDKLKQYNCFVYCINPKTSANFRKSYSDMDKSDPKDSFILSDMARCQRHKSLTPVNGSGKLAIQRLTRHRRHISEQIVREKSYMLNNIFIKFSSFDAKFDGKTLFSNKFGNTAQEVLLEFRTPEDIVNTSIETLVEFLDSKSKGRFTDSKTTALLLQKCARSSYRLDKSAYDPINTAISSSMCILRCYESQLKSIDKEINNLVKGIETNEYQSLLSIPGIGPVFASGILSEIGSITQFPNEEALAKYAGITWRTNQSGKFNADETSMTKTGNSFLRYYLIEAAQMAILHNPIYNEYYTKKYNEVTTHQHTRAIVLTSRKLIRLIYGLMSKNQLYKA